MEFARVIREQEEYGLSKMEVQTQELGDRVRAVCDKFGFKSVAQEGWKAPTVIVVYSDISGMVGKFKGEGIQVAGGVPFKIGEKIDPKTVC